MRKRRLFRAVIGLALMAASLEPCFAEPDTQARAQVFTRGTTDGARLTFEWDSREKVPFSVTRRGDQVTLHFEEPVSLRWGSALKAVHPYIRQVETRDGGNTVVLTMSEPSKAHYLEYDGPRDDGNDKNGVDLSAAKETDDTDVASSEDTETPAPREVPKTDTRAKARLARAKKLKEARMARLRHKREEQQQEAKDLSALAPGAGEASAPSPSPSPATAASTVAPPEKAMLPAVSPSATPSPKIVPAAPVAPVAVSPAPAAALTEATIPLPFKDEDAFAVFQWKNTLWIVSTSPTPPTADDLRKAGGNLVGEVKQLPDPHATILYMPLNGDLSASVQKPDQERPNILLSAGPAKLAQTLVPSLVTPGSGKASITLPAAKARGAVTFRNPLSGDMITVIPTTDSGVGAGGQKFIDFSLLPSAQGIAVQSLNDALTVTLGNGLLSLATPDGLTLSAEAKEQMHESLLEATAARTPSVLFPYARWRLEDETAFVPAQVKLMNEIVFGPPDAANKTRLKLLGLYLSEGLFTEALGVSDDILRSSLKFYQDNRVSAMRGAAYLFAYRLPEAVRDFSAPELQNDHEAQMFYNLCQELLGAEVKEPFNFEGNYDRYISHYPPPFISKLAIIAADRAISRRKYEDAQAIFDTLKKDNYDEPVKKYVDYMRAEIFSQTHDEVEAAKIWEDQSKDLDDPLIRARAGFSLINMQLKSDKMTHGEAEKKLEQLRLVWRGDGLEVSILTLLGNLYVQDKQYAKALHTMRDIVLYYPDLPQAITTARQMEEIFVDLYGKGGAGEMPPIEALSLFYEFRDLVPLGKDGDQMIRNLADRLVGLDLLDRAAVLLEHQIRNRLVGEERSRVAAQLAHIYLVNHQPEQALNILKMTGYGDLPPDLQLQRLRLTAQALAQQGQPGRAIDVISSDNSQEGTLLRLSIYWDNKDWQNVISIAEDILGNRSDPSAALTTPESEVLLKLATAYVYEHDTGQLQYLRDYFTPLMKNNPNRDNFRFITSESGAVDYDNLANLDQDISTVKNYLDKSQDKPGKNGFSNKAATN